MTAIPVSRSELCAPCRSVAACVVAEPRSLPSTARVRASVNDMSWYQPSEPPVPCVALVSD